MNQENDYVKECMTKWAKNGYSIMFDQWENMGINGLKFSLNYNLKKFFIK